MLLRVPHVLLVLREAAATAAAAKAKAKAAAAAAAAAADTSVSMPKVGQIYISEDYVRWVVAHCHNGLRSPTVRGQRRSTLMVGR